MGSNMFRLIVLVSCFCLGLANDDFLGCGGYIQVDNDVGLDLSKVEIRLYTKAGSLKYHTDCAPNNGYYFIPVYDKGDYTIRVVAPEGWSFSPSEVAISVDKVADKLVDAQESCSTGKDINFHFQGFSISGKVLSRGRTTGPSGISVELVAENSVVRVATTEGGSFFFENVYPGSYLLKARHDTLQLNPSELPLKLDSTSVVISSGLEVVGYQVRGDVISEGEPIQGVLFSLYSDHEDSAGGCGLEPVSRSVIDGDWRLLCETVSDLKGQFVFPVVSPGRYRLVPLYHGENIRFDIRPPFMEFQVEDSSLNIHDQFEVQGFRVSGRVVEFAGGPGLVGAEVFLNGKPVSASSADGHYHLENIKTGIYHLTAQSQDMTFDEMTVRISPNTPSLPDIAAAKYQVCGSILLAELPEGVKLASRKVIFIPGEDIKLSTDPELVDVDGSGSFCTFLKPGSYKMEPMVLEAEVGAGLKFVPESHQLLVEHSSQSGFTFGQFRGSIRGRVESIIPGEQVSVQLTGQRRPLQALITSGSFEFADILPGKYTVTVIKPDWCWKSSSIQLEVVDGAVDGVVFIQTGFVLHISASHDVDVDYTLLGAAVQQQKLSVLKGSNAFCMDHAGPYDFTAKSCHIFEPKTIQWTSSSSGDKTLSLIAKQHRTGVKIESDDNVPLVDMSVSATSSGEIVKLVLDSVSPLEGASSAGFVHHFLFNGVAGQTYEIEPSAADGALFFPAKVSLVVGNDCDDDAATIITKKGLFLTGRVVPAIAHVPVKITNSVGSVVSVVMTDDQGTYSYGPVNKEDHLLTDLAGSFDVSAEMKGYIITKDPSRFGDLVAEKLAEIIITVTDVSGEPLAGVLVAAAGGVGYRQNSVTGADGKVLLGSLNPGDYFIKPVLKEYRFDPISKLVHIDDGATVQLTIRGERVAFSCYGIVTSLNGEPESSVAIEAVGVGESCTEYQEESSSEANGQFRIRGLLPQCEYIVGLKSVHGSNIERTLPQNMHVKVEDGDMAGLRFVVIKSVNQADVVVSVQVEQRDHLKSLKLKVFKQDQPDSIVHSIKLDKSAVVILPPLPMDSATYSILLESSLARNIYDHHSQQATFTTNLPVQNVAFDFKPTRKMIDPETTQVSLRAVLTLLILAIGSYNYRALEPLVSHLFQLLSAAIKSNRSSFSSTSTSTGMGSAHYPVFSEQELALMEVAAPAKKKVKPKKA